MGARLDLPQVHHRSVSQLTREQTELVAAVAVRRRLGARQQPGAAQILRAQRVTQHVLLGQVEQGQSRRGLGHDGRTDEGLESADSGEACRWDGPGAGLLRVLHRQPSQRRVVER